MLICVAGSGTMTSQCSVNHLGRKVEIQVTHLETGSGFQSPNEGATCSVTFLSDNTGNQSAVTAIAETKEWTIGETDSFRGWIVDSYLQKMKLGERVKLSFPKGNRRQFSSALSDGSPSKPGLDNVDIKLVGFERAPEFWDMDSKAKLEKSRKHKSKGSELFKIGDIEAAFMRFSRAAKYLILMGKKADVEPELQEQWNLLTCQVYFNLSLCQMKYNNHSAVISNCTKVLEHDRTHVKALFKRGTAYMDTNDYDRAKEDLVAALDIEPNNKVVRNELSKVNQLLKREQEKMTVDFGKMFK